MRSYTGQVIEVRIDHRGNAGAWIACPAGAVPAAGQYLTAYAREEKDACLATPLFASQGIDQWFLDKTGFLASQGFLASPPIPKSWGPGSQLHLQGPLGRGFRLPAQLDRLALAALGDTADRLLLLVRQAIQTGCAVALFTDLPLPEAPITLEVLPASALPEALSWAEFLGLDIPLELLPELRSYLGLNPGEALACQAQALITTAMPCGGLADCGACAVPAHRGWKLACKDGPVFNLKDIEW